MKMKVYRTVEIELDGSEYNLIIHALQSHARIGDDAWPGEATRAAEMRDELMNFEDNERNERF